MLLRQLKYCVAVRDLRSFTKAADYCCVTQPTLSQQIAELETHLGITLFERKKPVDTTAEGRIILAEAEEIIRKCDFLENLAKQLKSRKICY